MLSSATGYGNTCIGKDTMRTATAVNKTTVVGELAMYSHSGSGDEGNTMVGYEAGYTETTGWGNSFFGYRAGYNITSGAHNTNIGYLAGQGATTGNYNINLGRASSPSSATAGNECTLGDGNISSLRCNDTSISSLSDQRDKTEIVDLPIGLDFINALKPRKFKLATRNGNVKDGKYRAGFIAQELQALESSTSADYLDLVLDTNPDRLEAKEGHLLPVLIKAVQELSAKVTALEAA